MHLQQEEFWIVTRVSGITLSATWIDLWGGHPLIACLLAQDFEGATKYCLEGLETLRSCGSLLYSNSLGVAHHLAVAGKVSLFYFLF